MALPTCPKCGGNSFDAKSLRDLYEGKGPVILGVVIVYCDNCGHIVGCGYSS